MSGAVSTANAIQTKANTAKDFIGKIMNGEFSMDSSATVDEVWSDASPEKKENIKLIGREIAAIKNKNSDGFKEYMNAKIFKEINPSTVDKNLNNIFKKASNEFTLTKGKNQTEANKVNANATMKNMNFKHANIIGKINGIIDKSGKNKQNFIGNNGTNVLTNFRNFPKINQISRKDFIEFMLKLSLCFEEGRAETNKNEPKEEIEHGAVQPLDKLAMRMLSMIVKNAGEVVAVETPAEGAVAAGGNNAQASGSSQSKFKKE